MKIYYLFYLPGAQITEEALQFQLCCKVITELSIVMHYITALLKNVMSRLWSRGLRVLCCQTTGDQLLQSVTKCETIQCNYCTTSNFVLPARE